MGLNIRAAQDATPPTDPRLPPRDHYDRPKVWLPDGSKQVAYARTSKAGEILEDTRSLMEWKCRNVLRGAVMHPDLAQQAKGLDPVGDKKEIGLIASQLQELAGASDKAERGTEFHLKTELEDAGGVELDPWDPQVKMLAAYQRLVEQMRSELGYEIVGREVFGVNDILQVAGTIDIVGKLQDRYCVIDIKTSGSMDFGLGKFGMQILGYAGMHKYDHHQATQGLDTAGLGVGRSPLAPGDLDQAQGYILWVPQGDSGVAQLAPINLQAAVAGYTLAEELREWRNLWKRKAYKFTPVLTASAQEKRGDMHE